MVQSPMELLLPLTPARAGTARRALPSSDTTPGLSIAPGSIQAGWMSVEREGDGVGGLGWLVLTVEAAVTLVDGGGTACGGRPTALPVAVVAALSWSSRMGNVRSRKLQPQPSEFVALKASQRRSRNGGHAQLTVRRPRRRGGTQRFVRSTSEREQLHRP